MSSGRSASAVSRSIIENDLIEEFHWLPQEIEKIPYKKLKMFYLIRREKSAARQTKAALDEMRIRQGTGSKTSSRGQTKRR